MTVRPKEPQQLLRFVLQFLQKFFSGINPRVLFSRSTFWDSSRSSIGSSSINLSIDSSKSFCWIRSRIVFENFQRCLLLLLLFIGALLLQSIKSFFRKFCRSFFRSPLRFPSGNPPEVFFLEVFQKFFFMIQKFLIKSLTFWEPF